MKSSIRFARVLYGFSAVVCLSLSSSHRSTAVFHSLCNFKSYACKCPVKKWCLCASVGGRWLVHLFYPTCAEAELELIRRRAPRRHRRVVLPSGSTVTVMQSNLGCRARDRRFCRMPSAFSALSVGLHRQARGRGAHRPHTPTRTAHGEMLHPGTGRDVRCPSMRSSVASH